MSSGDVELKRDSDWALAVKLRTLAGAPIVKNTLMRILLSPLTQWNIADNCAVLCAPYEQVINGERVRSKCAHPVCHPEKLVGARVGGPGSRRNVMKLTFQSMDPITDQVMHTVVLVAFAQRKLLQSA